MDFPHVKVYPRALGYHVWKPFDWWVIPMPKKTSQDRTVLLWALVPAPTRGDRLKMLNLKLGFRGHGKDVHGVVSELDAWGHMHIN